MRRKRLLIAGVFLVIVVALVSWFILKKEEPPRPAATEATTATSAVTLSQENVELLQKLGSSNEQERLQALMPVLRENSDIKAALAAHPAKVQIFADTFRVDGMYASVEAQLTGDTSERVKFILQPDDDHYWHIITREKG